MLKILIICGLLFNTVLTKNCLSLDKIFTIAAVEQYNPMFKTNRQIQANDVNNSTSQKSTPSFLYTSSKTQASAIYQNSLWLIILGFFVSGIILAFTPCVFPMLPILLTIISGKNTTPKKSFILALSYILGNALSYAIAGILAAQFGKYIQSFLQTPAITIAIIIIFILFSLSLLGFFELRLPHRINNKLGQIMLRHNKVAISSAFIAGAISALILSPCITAPLAGALLYISSTGNILIGGISLFMLGLGSGIPLLCIALFGNSLLPKSGNWMNIVKYNLAYLMLLMAIYFASRILNNNWTNLILGIFLIIASSHIFLLTLKHRLRIIIKIMLTLCYITIILFNIFYLITPSFKGLFYQNATYNQSQLHNLPKQAALKFQTINTRRELNQILSIAKNNHIPAILDFSAQWCMACKEMDLATFHDPKIINILANYVKIRVDITVTNAETLALQKKYGVFAPPSLVFIDQEGNFMPQQTIIGYISAAKLYTIIFAQISNSPTSAAKNKTYSQNYQPQVGDLLFQDLNCGVLCNGIGQVTHGIGNTYLSHVGMIATIDHGTPMIIEAIGESVIETPLPQFLTRSHDENNQPIVIVERLKPQYQRLIPQAITYAKRQLGKPYNADFTPNHGKSFYCSELIYAAFSYANHNTPIFSLNTMSFNDPQTKHITPEWKTYFNQIKATPPQGQLGTNPGMMSRESNLEVVYCYGKLRKR